jgi:hypothetical protein
MEATLHELEALLSKRATFERAARSFAALMREPMRELSGAEAAVRRRRRRSGGGGSSESLVAAAS